MTHSFSLLVGLCLVGMIGITTGNAEDDAECMVKGALTLFRILDCGDCVENLKCMYCDAPLLKTCFPFPSGGLIPSSNICSIDNARWGVCKISYKALLIIVGVALVVLLLSIVGCCCCCCCSRNRGYRNP